MATSNKNRQKKLMKKRRKEKVKKKQTAMQHATSPERSIVRRAAEFPVLECLINEGWQEEGFAMIVVARKQSEQLVCYGTYVVDLYCLGVKKTFADAGLTRTDYRDGIRAMMSEEYDANPITLELVHQIVYGAIDYARELGFRPHRDFSRTRHVLGPPDAFPRSEDIEFGKDGKPLYISGPDDNPKRIVKQLEMRLGADGFHFMIGGPEV